ncbi:modification methylase NgoBI [Gloeomargarita lithophora Alchichica-D10]|uniref:Cytosine-specific methyltransferase n=1 Tax=Gloeomargarita lithophora Alchichica-D10 TaxID=1188229 RepID=A0A1J0AD29_9CYAN|nr:DNA (cytosine-5-)-methyltransferase [Gloeomargarita lithophora]APB33844.1 modification methylase NgoBI [Gloeomargarita lithophora Alchichica-D10]
MIRTLKFCDLFCGIGGFRLAAQIAGKLFNLEPLCVFSSDIDPDAQKIYEANFGEKPAGDIKKIEAHQIPDHDVLFAGFPCQPFSICGDMNGFDDMRGTLFFDIVRILEKKRPRVFILENVKQLKGHDQGRTLRRILSVLSEIGYYADYSILNALDFGLPQKRERIFIVGFPEPTQFAWPRGDLVRTSLSEILETNVSDFYSASEKIKSNRMSKRLGKQQYDEPTIWHENKGGNVSAYPFSCALRAGASYNYLLVNGERRLTEREMLRLQGFPDSYKIVGSYQVMRKLTGNSIAIPCVVALLNSVLEAMGYGLSNPIKIQSSNQLNITPYSQRMARIDQVTQKP